MSSTLELLTPISRGSNLRADTTTSLVQAVLKGELKAGDKLIVRKLAAQLGVSATPVREAIVELEAIGILDVLPNQSATIRHFGPQELFEIYHMRGLLESEATRLATPHVPEKWLNSVREEIGQLKQGSTGSLDEWAGRVIEHDRQFHRSIAEHCGMSRLSHELGRYSRLMGVMRNAAKSERNGLQQTLSMHLRVIEAMILRDRELAARRMAEHVYRAAIFDIGVVYGKEAAANLELDGPFVGVSLDELNALSQAI